jgi:hypothetical protein
VSSREGAQPLLGRRARDGEVEDDALLALGHFEHLAEQFQRPGNRVHE